MLLDQNIWVGTSRDGAVCLLPKMANRHGLISGATGLVGSYLVDVLMHKNEEGLGCRVYAPGIKGNSKAVISAYTEYGLEAAVEIELNE